ncbi:MAG: Flp family type IVb pilin [Chlorobiales bacterium]|nr:Flp family type IVb pilin [Chlorobiales bacterium]
MIEYVLMAILGKFFSISSIKSQKGVTMIEYALMAALVAVALIVTLGLLAGGLDTIFDAIIDALEGAIS